MDGRVPGTEPFAPISSDNGFRRNNVGRNNAATSQSLVRLPLVECECRYRGSEGFRRLAMLRATSSQWTSWLGSRWASFMESNQLLILFGRWFRTPQRSCGTQPNRVSDPGDRSCPGGRQYAQNVRLHQRTALSPL